MVLGKCTSVRLAQPENTDLSIDLTVSGIFTVVSEVQL